MIQNLGPLHESMQVGRHVSCQAEDVESGRTAAPNSAQPKAPATARQLTSGNLVERPAATTVQPAPNQSNTVMQNATREQPLR